MKCADPGGKGPVRMMLRQRGGTIDAIVEDDGAGTGAGMGPHKPNGSGTRIVRAMASKLGAEPVYDPRPHGTRVRRSVPCQVRDGRAPPQMRGTMMSRSTGLPPTRWEETISSMSSGVLGVYQMPCG